MTIINRNGPPPTQLIHLTDKYGRRIGRTMTRVQYDATLDHLRQERLRYWGRVIGSGELPLGPVIYYR